MSFFRHIQTTVQQYTAPPVTNGIEPALEPYENNSNAEPSKKATTRIGDPAGVPEIGENVTLGLNNHPADLENQKYIVRNVDLGEEGAQRIELMQEVWGKHGKIYIFLSYVVLDVEDVLSNCYVDWPFA